VAVVEGGSADSAAAAPAAAAPAVAGDDAAAAGDDAAALTASPGEHVSPISSRQHRRLERAVDRAEELTGLQFAVYLGPTRDDSRQHAEAMFHSLGYHALPAVLLVVAPDQRRLEIVTSPAARTRISDRHAALAATSMTASFAVGDIVGGICLGLDMLARYAGPPREDAPLDAELPDVLLGYDEQP
jgi:uncharacterized membrane protein YgcG